MLPLDHQCRRISKCNAVPSAWKNSIVIWSVLGDLHLSNISYSNLLCSTADIHRFSGWMCCLFWPENGGKTFLWNISKYLPVKTMPQLRQLVASFPPRQPRFEPGPGHVGFVVDKAALRQVFSKYFGFPCQCTFHQSLHTHHLSFRAGTIGQTLAAVPNGLSLTPWEVSTRLTNITSQMTVFV
jgi:hypothetical protein